MDYNQIIINIRQIIRALDIENKRIEKQLGLSIPQLLLLNFLKSKTDFKSIHSEIKNYLHLNSSTVTGIISRLEKKGLIIKSQAPNDKRVVPIILTAKGLHLLNQSPSLLHNQLIQKLNNLPAEKVQELVSATELLASILNVENIDAAPILFSSEINN